jgi:hypothetical protein
MDQIGERMRSLTARFPAGSAWPAEMRADMVAAYLDYQTSGKMMAGISRGEVPPPTATRIFNGRRISVWARAACDAFVQRRHVLAHDAASNDNAPVREVELG